MMFDSRVKFKYKWRSYQRRIVDEFERHHEDKHLHFIAPPGAGKTVLGLELIRKLNQPVIILTPNIGIRDQWKQRFIEAFVSEDQQEFWNQVISHDIESNSQFIVTTYQSFFSKSKSLGTLHTQLRHIETLVLDEAHHLKNSWMKAIDSFKDFKNLTSISLTATPPYDSSFNEWKAYIKVNGPIDAEISIVELVRSGTLCPHQDYIYPLVPTEEDLHHEAQFLSIVNAEKESLFGSFDLIEFYSFQSWILEPWNNHDWIFKNFDLYLFAVQFLYFKNSLSNSHAHANILDIQLEELQLNFHKDEELFVRYYLENSDNGLILKQRYIKKGILVDNTLMFNIGRVRNSVLKKSISRLSAIKTIVEKESESLGSELRLVILTSRIQDELIKKTEEYQVLPNQIAVFPIFEYIRRNVPLSHFSMKIGILTGSYTVIPRSALLYLEYIEDEYKWTDYPYDDHFVMSKTPNQGVLFITELLEQGEIEVLIGTQSLLGEGWDAPSINTLILANEISSFVTTNQMRGRAIRSSSKTPEKASHIWHLGSSPLHKFSHFMGPYNSLDKKGITTGLERYDVNKLNIDTWITQRSELKNHWQDSIKLGSEQVNSIKLPPKKRSYKFLQLRSFKVAYQLLGRVIWETLIELQLIRSQGKSFELICKQEMNSSRIYLRNIGVQEEELFLECLEQILYPKGFSKYMILRHQSWWSELFFNPNSHIPLIVPIPLEFSKNKSRAKVFFKNFKDIITDGQLVDVNHPVAQREITRRMYLNKVNQETTQVRESSWG